jgi:hypothetical protein
MNLFTMLKPFFFFSLWKVQYFGLTHIDENTEECKVRIITQKVPLGFGLSDGFGCVSVGPRSI